ncbi:hypothetical protein JCGZ_09984 [Jatropha curcas]|uniref:Aminotransferase-like plant mobile domain-containing protein n=1 Tax=Jatropha curcas TaxID=180498 RepID=A0A067KLW7_JATCU|nr:hypothetical protein JCGZ_09984 [Jatropha curcas]
MTSIYAQDSRIKLDVGESSVAGVAVEIFDQNNPTWAFEHFPYTRPELLQPIPDSGLAPLAWRWYKSNLHPVRHKKSVKELRTFFDTCPLEQTEVGPMTARLQGWIQADPDFQRRRPMTDPTSSTPTARPSQVGPSRLVGPFRAPRAILEATGPLHPDLASLRLPYGVSYFVPHGPPAFREVSIEGIDRTVLPSEDITEVPVGLINQMMELFLGMQQELAAAWTQTAFDDERGRRPRHR